MAFFDKSTPTISIRTYVCVLIFLLRRTSSDLRLLMEFSPVISYNLLFTEEFSQFSLSSFVKWCPTPQKRNAYQLTTAKYSQLQKIRSLLDDKRYTLECTLKLSEILMRSMSKIKYQQFNPFKVSNQPIESKNQEMIYLTKLRVLNTKMKWSWKHYILRNQKITRACGSRPRSQRISFLFVNTNQRIYTKNKKDGF